MLSAVMPIPAEQLPPPPFISNGMLTPYNLCNKVCAYCKRPGALLKCEGCRQRRYCNRKCQKKDWKQQHRGQCDKLHQGFARPLPGWRGSAVEVGGCGGGAAAAASGRAAAAAVVEEDDEIENPCPICLDNEDDADVDGNLAGMCSTCGQFYCGACSAGGLADRSPNCPTCRAPIGVSGEELFKRCWKLVHGRSAGRHTLAAQCSLGDMYDNGEGVKQDHVEAVKWYRKSAEAGDAMAQFNLAAMYAIGNGVEQDFAEALKWTQLAAEQGFKGALLNLDLWQQGNVIPTPPPGTGVTTILLTSANAASYNNKAGRVVKPAEGTAIKPGRVAVLLDGEVAPISFKLKNIRVHP